MESKHKCPITTLKASFLACSRGACRAVMSHFPHRLLQQQELALFVFSIDDLKQNAGSLLTSVSYTVCYALSYGTLGFALHGSSLNHILIGGNSSTANQIL